MLLLPTGGTAAVPGTIREQQQQQLHCTALHCCMVASVNIEPKASPKNKKTTRLGHSNIGNRLRSTVHLVVEEPSENGRA